MNTPKRYGADGFSKSDGCFVEWEEYAKLSVEVRRLRKASFVTAVPCEHYERVVQAGDAMYYWLGVCGRRNSISDDWLRAKKGLPSLDKQWEREKENRARNAAKEGKSE